MLQTKIEEVKSCFTITIIFSIQNIEEKKGVKTYIKQKKKKK